MVTETGVRFAENILETLLKTKHFKQTNDWGEYFSPAGMEILIIYLLEVDTQNIIMLNHYIL